ncbi:MAG: SBBP repeat-containing protein, partial [Verrucomicrobiota bacterium]
MNLSLRSIRWAIYGALLWMAFAPLARLRGQSFQWVTIAGSTRDEIAQFMTVDLAGNTYLTGHIGGSTSFGNTTLVATEAELMFLAKFNAMGQPVWAIQAQGNSNSEGRAVAVDRDGNVFVTGYFTGTTRFEATELLSRGLGDLFVAKYDSSGHLLWVRQAGGDDASSPEFSRAIAVDFRGHCYVFAEFRGTADVGAFRLTASNGLTSFLAKYDTDGNVLWARNIAPCSYDDRRGIAFDPWGNIVLAANFRGAVSFGDQTLASAGA